MNDLQQTHPRIDVRRYAGRWVSLDPQTHQVVADGVSLAEARRAAIRQGIERPLVMMVPESQGFFVGIG